MEGARAALWRYERLIAGKRKALAEAGKAARESAGAGGRTLLGAITDAEAAFAGFKRGGEVFYDDKARSHFEGKHSAQFKSVGFKDGHEMASFVMAGCDAAYAANNGAVRFVRRIQGREREIYASVIAYPDKNGGFRIATAHPLRKDALKRKTPLWERAQTDHPNNGAPSAISGQSGVEKSISAGNAQVNGKPARAPFEDLAGALGATYTDSKGRSILRLFQGHDQSTVLHEMSHAARRQMQIIASQPNASGRTRAEYAALEREYGIEPGGRWTAEAEEAFARNFERYCLEGAAPAPELAFDGKEQL